MSDYDVIVFGGGAHRGHGAADQADERTGKGGVLVGSTAPQLAGQTVVVLGDSAGIGLETARLARAEGADVIITGRDAGRLDAAAREVGARRAAAFDAFDPAAVKRFFQDLPAPIDHVMVTAGAPSYGPCSRWTRPR